MLSDSNFIKSAFEWISVAGSRTEKLCRWVRSIVYTKSNSNSIQALFFTIDAVAAVVVRCQSVSSSNVIKTKHNRRRQHINAHISCSQLSLTHFSVRPSNIIIAFNHIVCGQSCDICGIWHRRLILSLIRSFACQRSLFFSLSKIFTVCNFINIFSNQLHLIYFLTFNIHISLCVFLHFLCLCFSFYSLGPMFFSRSVGILIALWQSQKK